MQKQMVLGVALGLALTCAAVWLQRRLQSPYPLPIPHAWQYMAFEQVARTPVAHVSLDARRNGVLADYEDDELLSWSGLSQLPRLVDEPALSGEVLAISKLIGTAATTSTTSPTTSNETRRSGSTPLLAKTARPTTTSLLFEHLLDAARLELLLKASVVTAPHFSIDALTALYTLLNPREAWNHRSTLEDIARFDTDGFCESRRAACIYFTLDAHTDPDRALLPPPIFEVSNDYERGNELFKALLPVLTNALKDVARYQRCWEVADNLVRDTFAAVQANAIAVAPLSELDVVVVTRRSAEFDCNQLQPMAIYYTCKQRKGTILVCDEVEGNHFLLYLPAPDAARQDLSLLATQLTDIELTKGNAVCAWQYDGTRLAPKVLAHRQRPQGARRRIPGHPDQAEDPTAVTVSKLSSSELQAHVVQYLEGKRDPLRRTSA